MSEITEKHPTGPVASMTFRCQHVTSHADEYDSARLVAIRHQDPSNNDLSGGQPTGTIEITNDNDSELPKFFTPGGHYLVTIVKLSNESEFAELVDSIPE